MRPRRHLPLFAALGLLAGGCESTQVAPATHGAALLETDEQRLWNRVLAEQAQIERSGFVAAWPEAEAYLDRIVARLNPGPLPGGARFRVKIVVDPTLNAFALPNGAIYVHTGLLAQLQNEAQLATVLAHELTHATHRHGLKSYRNIKNESAFLAGLTFGSGGVGGLLGVWGVMASVSGYSRDLEREADVHGFELLRQAGYEPRECARVFQLFLAESQRAKLKEPFFFGSHPRLKERIASFEQLAAALPAAQRTGALHTAEFETVLPPVLIANARAALSAGDFDAARASAERSLRLRPADPDATFQLAELHRKRAAAGDAEEALRHFHTVLAAQPHHAEAQRGLGLTCLKLQRPAEAAPAFRRYLELRPAANDRAHIETFLLQCENTL